MKSLSSTKLMKVAAYLLAAAIVAPAAILLGASTVIVASVATTISVLAIALNDYGKPTCTYGDSVLSDPTERHPLAA